MEEDKKEGKTGGREGQKHIGFPYKKPASYTQ